MGGDNENALEAAVVVPAAGVAPESGPVTADGIWTRRRLEIARWLGDKAPSLLDVYRGAVLMASDPAFPGRLHYVGHAVRDIANRLPEIISGTRGEYLDYKSRFDELVAAWQRSGYPLDGRLPGLEEETEPTVRGPDILVNRGLLLQVSQLVADHERTRERPIAAARRLFESLVPELTGNPAQADPVVRQWVTTNRWFMKVTHLGVKPRPEADGQELLPRLERFEQGLYTLIAPFFETIEDLDEILGEANI